MHFRQMRTSKYYGWRLPAAVLPILLLWSVTPALGCAITVREPLKYAFKAAPVAFEGTLERISENGEVHFRVLRRWKGSDEEVVMVTNSLSNCGYPSFRVGERYVVVPEPDGGVHGGSNIEEVHGESVLAKVLDDRASWWRCPLSSFTPRAILRAAGRRLS